jgi:hypothetical protein
MVVVVIGLGSLFKILCDLMRVRPWRLDLPGFKF